jgi:hypothetical protein
MIINPPIIAPSGLPHAPVDGTGLDLINIAEELSFKFPAWLNTQTGLLSRLITCVGDIFDPLREEYGRVSALFNASLSEPRLVYHSFLPSALAKITTTQFISAYYRFSSSGNWISIYSLPNISELFVSDGPCVFIQNNESLFRNLEKVTIVSVGTLSGDYYVHTLNGVLEDTDILFSEDYTLPGNRWSRYSPSTYFRPENNIVLTNSSSGYINYSVEDYETNLEILWVTDSTSGFSTCSPLSLYNTWDRLSTSLGLRRVPGETNVSLRKKALSAYRFGEDTSRKNFLLNICRELSAVEFYEWDGITVLELPSGTTDVLVSTLPERWWTQEFLQKTDTRRGFTSSKRDWDYIQIKFENSIVQPQAIDNNVLTLGYEGDTETYTRAEARIIYKNWEISGSYLVPTKNIPVGKYYVAAFQGISGNALTNVKTRIFNDSRLTDFGTSVLKELNRIKPFVYGRGRWNQTNFYEREDVAPRVTYLPQGFED